MVNSGNGAAGPVIDALEARFKALNVPVTLIKVHNTPDGNFPNGIPNPLLPECRDDTRNAVIEHGADMGIAFDGDFDRCFLFDETGQFIEGYYIVGLLAEAFLEKNPGAKIIHDPRLSWNTVDVVTAAGGTPVMSKTGHAFIKERMRKDDAIYGGEMSAHHYFRDFAYCDSGMIPWLLVSELLCLKGKTLGELVRVNHAVHQAKLENKKRLAEYIAQQLNVVVNPKALFDVQIKRIHEYKRQLMNVLHVITRYNRIKADPDAKWVPRVNIFGGKAASAYYMAKHIIHLINDVAKVINNDPQIGDKLKVVFIPNYSVSLAQLIIPAADLSEQISLAGTEASGTSNMKFALNGALTIGTLDGANVEMLDHVGADNIFIFGNTAEEVEELRRQGYKPREYYEKDEELHQVLTQIGSGVFSPEDPGRYRDLVDSLINFGDHYQVLADYRSYVDCQDKVDELYELQEEWTAKAMLNIANMGYFSSDRTIKEYADHIWHIDPVRL